jgi:hypothetical protein
MLTLDFAGTTADRRRVGATSITLVQLHNDLWRVTRPAGEVLGYVEKFMSPDGTRYRAKRLLVAERRFVPIGEFWAFDEAVDCFAW